MKLVLLLLLAQQQASVAPVDLAVIRQPDGGVVEVVGGAWFSTAEVIEMGKDHARLRAENETYEKNALKWLVIAASSGVVLGATVGFAAGRLR